MPAFLFLRKFGGGHASLMPHAQVMQVLTKHGNAVVPSAPQEFVFEPDTIASRAWVIGGPDGVTCIGLEEPYFDEGLRSLAWDCMDALGCSIFSDSLDRVYQPLHAAPADLPQSFLAACAQGVQPVGHAWQFWPPPLETLIPQVETYRYALVLGRPGSDKVEFQVADRFDPALQLAGAELHLNRAACDPATLMVLMASCRRLHWALHDKPGARIEYRFGDSEVGLRFVEADKLAGMDVPVTFVSPFPSEAATDRVCFVSDRELHHSMMGEALGFMQSIRDQHGPALDGSVQSIGPLSEWLQRQHHAVSGSTAPPATETWRVAIAAGCYVADVIRRHVGGQFGYVVTGTRRVPVVLAHRGAVLHPQGAVLGHLLNGETQPLARWFEQISGAFQSAAAREHDLVRDIHGYCAALRGRGAAVQQLPLGQYLAREQLDYGIESLPVLDGYLARVAGLGWDAIPQRDALVVVLGAYLGEVVRSAAEPGTWRWKTHADTALEQPGFAERRPEALAFLAILDSARDMAYPLAHVQAMLQGERASCVDFAATLLDLAPSGKPQPAGPPDATCPNCTKLLHTSQARCTHCGAEFSAPDGWRPVPLDPLARPPAMTPSPVLAAASTGAWRKAVYKLGRFLTYVAHVPLCLGLLLIARDLLGATGQDIPAGVGLGWVFMSGFIYLPAAILCAIGKRPDPKK